MTSLVLPVLTLCVATLLAGAGAVLAFFRRTPAAAVSFAAMLVAALSGLVVFDSGSLWFWGCAAVIAAIIPYAAPVADSQARLYTVGAALAGSAVGLVGGTVAWVVLGAAAGAFLGFFAYTRTPRGVRAGASLSRLDILAALGLPAVVNFSIIMLIFAQLIQI